MNAIKTKNDLDFEAAPWPLSLGEPQMAYRVGTCQGIYYFEKDSINIVVINNDSPGNGHLEDVFQWFEFSAQANNLDLYIRAFFNDKFKTHCINKRGFMSVNEYDVVKRFKI